MQHTVYHKDTTRTLARHPKVKTNLEHFATEAAAKAALTREVKRGAVKAEDFLIAPTNKFWNEIEKTEVVKNLMSGKDVVQSVNTPHCCNPSTETYWSM